jgi:ABC-2 type transport system permease protein
MNSHSIDSQPIAPETMSRTRPLYWSVRRELWENRSIYIAPLVVTAVVLFGSLFTAFTLPGKIRNLSTLEPAKRAAVVRPFHMTPAPIMFTTLLVGLFYSLDALYGERRDRSILFWKSLPVSDRETVLSKASIPLVILPLTGVVLSIATLTFLISLSTMVLLGSGVSPAPLLSRLNLFTEAVIMLYGVTVHALWFAPIYAVLLLVSAWAKRTPVLWVTLPPLAIAALEHMLSKTKHFAEFVGYRVTGAMDAAFEHVPNRDISRLSQLTPGEFLTTPGLWIGLLVAAASLAATIRLRRNREPI